MALRTRVLTQAVLILAVLTALARPAAASIITFTDRAAWLAAVGSVSFNVDFENFAADVFADSLDVGPFTITNPSPVRSEFDVPLVDTTSSSNSFAQFLVGGSDSASVVFDAFLTAWGADLSSEATILVASGGLFNHLIPASLQSLRFFGVIATAGEQFSNASFFDTSGCILGCGLEMDNVAGVVAPSTAPEPTSLVLLGSGLTSLAVRRRRARASRHSPER